MGISYRGAKRVVVAVIGATLLLLGVVMMPLPGPGTPVIFLALALLATEFVWARLWLRRLKVSTKRAGRRARARWWRRREPPGREPQP